MKKGIEYILIALYVAVVILLGTLEGNLQIPEMIKILLWLIVGMGFGFILPILHSRTQSFSRFVVYMAVITAICVVTDVIHGNVTALRIAESMTMFLSAMLGWYFWNKARCSNRKKIDIDA